MNTGERTFFKNKATMKRLCILDQLTLLKHNNGILPHDWFCKVRDTVCILLLSCFYFVFHSSLTIKKYVLLHLACLNYTFITSSHARLWGRQGWSVCLPLVQTEISRQLSDGLP